ALLLGALAASDVAGRERALARSVGRPVPVLVARRAVPAGRRLTAAMLAVREVPARYAPAESFAAVADVDGLRAAVPIPAGADLAPALVRDEAAGSPAATGGVPPGLRPLARGERALDLVATGEPAAFAPGGHVDVLVTRDGDGGAPGSTALALQDVEVLAVAPAGEDERPAGAPPGPRVALTLRVTLRQAVYLTAAQSFAREIRALPRAPGDGSEEHAPLRIGSGL
ncbi:MAG TPA: Flp pilus assembly protein CpaB, partial [Solirubrobacteraceae bacterium]|nr:Flp pilus assembly protein CpaB [Solirubrobacteraceae bacterium]